MQLTDAFCYILLTISVTATCVRTETQKQELSERKVERRLTKREAAVLIDNFPLETMFNRKPKVIYRRVSRNRYRAPKPKYGPPRPKYTTKPKKYKVKSTKPPISHKSPKKRPPKPRYGPPKRRPKPKYGPPKQMALPTFHTPPDSAGFAEPPTGYSQVYQTQQPSYGEPPVDSYGAPLQPLREQFPTAAGFSDSPSNYGNQETYFRNENNAWQVDDTAQHFDNSYAYSKHRPTYVKPLEDVFHETQNEDFDEEVKNLNSYSDVFKYGQNKHYMIDKKKKPQYHSDSLKLLKRPWKASNLNQQHDDEIIVGGRYAEPPARFAPKYKPKAPLYMEDEDIDPAHGFVAPEEIISTISPYVNYKHSNMAFSPQNLNDAFSIVDK